MDLTGRSMDLSIYGWSLVGEVLYLAFRAEIIALMEEKVANLSEDDRHFSVKGLPSSNPIG